MESCCVNASACAGRKKPRSQSKAEKREASKRRGGGEKVTLEERYREDVRAINMLYPKGSKAREEARAARREQLEADLYERDGNPTAIRRLQERFAVRYYNLVKSFYDGDIGNAMYLWRRVDALRAYAQRLYELGLLTEVFDDDWIHDFARLSLRRERELLPVKQTGFTDDDAWLLCNPLRQFSRRFFEAVHKEFGCDRLREHPKIYVGVKLQVRPD